MSEKKLTQITREMLGGGKIITLFLIFPIQIISKECRNSDCSLFGPSVLFQLNLKRKTVIYKSIKTVLTRKAALKRWF